MQLWSQRQGVGAGGGVPYDVDYLLVAGGGSGANNIGGGGGGGGGLVQATVAIPSGEALAITIGAGGAVGSTAFGTRGNTGSQSKIVSSTIGTVIKYGGGGGGAGKGDNTTIVGLNGGSGGGGGNHATANGVAQGGAGISGGNGGGGQKFSGGERQGGAGIAVSGHRHPRNAQLLSHRDGKCQASRLKRTSWQAPLVLDEDLAAAILVLQFLSR